MKTQRLHLLYAVLAIFACLISMPARAQYTLAPSFIIVTNDGTVTITGYTAPIETGPGGEVDIPNSTNGYPITGISSNAFNYCNPTLVTIPDSVTNIGEGAFGYCLYLTNIAVSAGNPSYTNLGGVLFDKGTTRLLQYPAGLAASNYTIPDSIARIGAHAFEGCGSLLSMTIPNSVTSIGDGAFYECFALTNVVIPNTVTNLGSYTFQNSGLLSVTIPDSITSIGKEVFSACSSLTNVTMANSVTNIDVGAFYGCSGLTSITIPGSVTNIGAWAFWNCPNLANIYFPSNAPTADSSAFSGDGAATVYYLPGTTGWTDFSNTTGVPIALWLPQMQTAGTTLGAQTNPFGFNVSWASEHTVVVEACTNLTNPVWQPMETNSLATGAFYFSDPQSTNYPGRFYRIRSPGAN